MDHRLGSVALKETNLTRQLKESWLRAKCHAALRRFVIWRVVWECGSRFIRPARNWATFSRAASTSTDNGPRWEGRMPRGKVARKTWWRHYTVIMDVCRKLVDRERKGFQVRLGLPVMELSGFISNTESICSYLFGLRYTKLFLMGF
jgi:hypothetical protein